MFTYNTEKGELCLIECWQDADYEERYEDGGRDLMWIDRHHSNEFGNIENYISEKFADISDTIYIEIHAIRASDVTVFEEGDEYYDLFPNNISIDDMGDDCMGGGSYVFRDGKFSSTSEPI
jgi:hypothetical protein